MVYIVDLSDPQRWTFIIDRKTYLWSVGAASVVVVIAMIGIGVAIFLDDDSPIQKAQEQIEQTTPVDPQEDEPEDLAGLSDEELFKKRLRKIYKSCDYFEKKLWSNLVHPAEIKTTFDDVFVPKSTLTMLKNLVAVYLNHSREFSYGVLANSTVPGILLHGPPGVGKTHLVKAIAKDCGAAVLLLSSADIFQMWHGEGEKMVRATFSLARKMQPCIIFCDEADAIFRSRNSRDQAWLRSTLNQFVQLWDGFTTDPSKWVLVILASNRADEIDEAVLRRVPKKIFLDIPDASGREAILKIHLQDEQLDEDVDLGAIVRQTASFTGSDLRDLCVNAAYNSVVAESQAPSGASKRAAIALQNTTTPQPRRRVLRAANFKKALEEISSSVDGQMAAKARELHRLLEQSSGVYTATLPEPMQAQGQIQAPAMGQDGVRMRNIGAAFRRR